MQASPGKALSHTESLPCSTGDRQNDWIQKEKAGENVAVFGWVTKGPAQKDQQEGNGKASGGLGLRDEHTGPWDQHMQNPKVGFPPMSWRELWEKAG